jgi:hypothetical protein
MNPKKIKYLSPIIIRTISIIAILGMFAGARAQPGPWLKFKDRTAQRLELSSVGIDDAEEKDIAVADFDLDGWDDVLVVRKTPFSNPGPQTDVLLMNEKGVLVDRTAEFAKGFDNNPTDARDVFVADFTGDGWPDVIIANTFNQQPAFYLNHGADGDGKWRGLKDRSQTRLPAIDPVLESSQPGPFFCTVWGGDVNGDGALDIYFSPCNPDGNQEFHKDVLLINDGNGFFTNETQARLGDYANVSFGTGIEIHDMNNDGYNDIVKLSTGGFVDPFDAIGVFILFNDGNGVFNTRPFQWINDIDIFFAIDTYMMTVGDLNNDGLLDVYLGDDLQDAIALAESINPDGTINYIETVLTAPRTEELSGNMRMADLDGNGYLDLGTAQVDIDFETCPPDRRARPFVLLQNNGLGFLEDPYLEDENFHQIAHDFGFIDIDRDGDLDIFQGLCTGWRVFVQTP